MLSFHCCDISFRRICRDFASWRRLCLIAFAFSQLQRFSASVSGAGAALCFARRAARVRFHSCRMPAVFVLISAIYSISIARQPVFAPCYLRAFAAANAISLPKEQRQAISAGAAPVCRACAAFADTSLDTDIFSFILRHTRFFH